ncbi:hypothetical protein THAOC_00706, partial [Thalassiosira oceanica]
QLEGEAPPPWGRRVRQIHHLQAGCASCSAPRSPTTRSSRSPPLVYNNTITSMKILCAETKSMGYEGDVLARDRLDFILGVDDQSEINDEIGVAIKELWTDPGVLKAWKRRAEYQIVESVKYYFNEIERIMQSDYVATQQDMLLARVRTSGIVTERYVIDGVDFEMYDVGGQRNERKKWIHCFDDVTAVIFVAALSEYDQALFEDSSANRMTEAVDLFGDICNNAVFAQSSSKCPPRLCVSLRPTSPLQPTRLSKTRSDPLPEQEGPVRGEDQGGPHRRPAGLQRLPVQAGRRGLLRQGSPVFPGQVPRPEPIRRQADLPPRHLCDRLAERRGCVQLVQGHHHEEEHGGHGHVTGGSSKAPRGAQAQGTTRLWSLGHGSSRCAN